MNIIMISNHGPTEIKVKSDHGTGVVSTTFIAKGKFEEYTLYPGSKITLTEHKETE